MSGMYANYEAIRNNRGLSNSDVSRSTGIAPSTLCDWKKGRYTPKLDKLMVIAKYFDVPLEEIIEKDGDAE